MRKSIIGLIVFLSPVLIGAGDKPGPEQVFFLPWGDAVEYREAPGGRFGPRSFLVDSGEVYLLNTNRNRIERIEQSSVSTVAQVPSYADDFTLADKEVYVLHNNQVFRIDGTNRAKVYHPQEPGQVITSLMSTKSNVIARLSNGNSRVLEMAQESVRKVQGAYISEEQHISVKKVDDHAVDLISESATRPERKTRITFRSALPVGSVQLLGVDEKGRTFLQVDFIVQQVPLKTRSAVYVYNDEMNLRYTINIPDVRYTYLFKRFQVTPGGALYHLISAKDGLYLYRWELDDTEETTESLELKYPEPLNSSDANYNDLYLPEYSPDFPEDMEEITTAEITRDEALATGDSYVQHTWNCQNTNMTDENGEEAPDGDWVKTPSWLSEGQMHKVPYQWGGFRSLSQFDTGIAGGGYAGDIHTDGVSSYAYGVDCSGFVSRCWNLPYQYSTRMMPDITGEYTEWSELQPADAIHKDGHVRMMVSWNENGSLNVVEASSADWRVSYRTFWLSQLGSYRPRYYVNMEGAPTALPTPVLGAVTIDGDSLGLRWECAQYDGVAGYHLYQTYDMQHWTLAQPLETLPLSEFQTGSLYTADTPVFYRLRTVDEADTTRESIMSDTYGAFRSDNTESPVLIVDGFDRHSGYGSWGSPYHAFAAKVGNILSGLGIPFETCANEVIIDQQIQLTDYAAVFWMVGDESTNDETFDAQEQSIVKDYLENGGQLFISGSEIGWDLDNKGTTGDRGFYNQYLKADYNVDDTGIYTAVGATGSIFEGLEVQYDDGSHNVYQEDYPDGVSGSSGGEIALEYKNSSYAAAIQYNGTFGGGTSPGKLVYLAFPVETIYDQTQLNEFVSRVVAFFGYDPATGVDNPPENIADVFRLHQNYPNPFNPVTTVDYTIPEPGEVLLQIFDLKGHQIVRRQLDHSASGKYSEKINLVGNASGTYFARLTWKKGETHKFSETRKLLLLK